MHSSHTTSEKPWAILLGIRRFRLREHRSERFIEVALLLSGAFTIVDGLVRLLSGT